jgi:hypothetical protein
MIELDRFFCPKDQQEWEELIGVAKRLTLLLGTYKTIEFGRVTLSLLLFEEFSGQKLWQEVRRQLNISSGALRTRRHRFFKWIIPLLVAYYSDPEFRDELDKLEADFDMIAA